MKVFRSLRLESTSFFCSPARSHFVVTRTCLMWPWLPGKICCNETVER